MAGWVQSELYITNKLNEMSVDIKQIKDSLVITNIEVTRLQTKSMMWGGIAGSIPVIIGLFLQWLSTR